MNEFTLYTFTGDALFDIVPEASSSHEWVLMSENRLSLTFELEQCVNLSPGCYVDFDGVRYYLLEEYKPQMVNSTAWKYNVNLFDAASWMSVTLALNLLDGQNTPIFNYTAPAVEHAQIIVANLNRRMGTTAWKVGSVIETGNITIEYRGKYCSDVLQEIVDGQNTEWWLDDMTLNIGRAEFGDTVELEYQNGLLGDIVCEQADNMRTYAYLCPIGSTRNIDPTKYGFERLQLPNGQTLVPMNLEQGIGELAEEKAFSKIFPRYEGAVKSVRSRPAKGNDGREFTIYYIGVALPFNPNEYEIAGLVKQITFLSGQLIGEDFEANYDSEAREFEIITRWPDGGDAQLPGGLLTPEVGDKYVIWNITMPDVYYTLAAQEFLEAAEAFAAEAIKDVGVYKAPLDYIEVQERGLRLRPGQRVRLLSDAYFSSGYYDSRITRITRDVLFPDAPRIEVSAVRATGTISRIQTSIQKTEAQVARLSGALPTVVKSGEDTTASDSSVYTSAKSEREFLNRRKGGAVLAPVDFIAAPRFPAGADFNGAVVKFDAERKCWIFPHNLLVEGGIAWNTKLEGFEEQTITAAVQVDWKTIGKNANGELYVIGGTSGGGGGVVGGVTLDEVKNYLSAEKYTTETWVSAQNYATQSQVDSALAKKWNQDDSLIANWNSAYSWGNHASAGYVKQSDITSEFSKYVTLSTAQTITGIKDFVNGLKIGGTSVTYNASKNAFVFPANAIFEGGVAWNASIDGFTPKTIMDAIIVDDSTISKANGYLEFIGKAGGLDETELANYLTNNNYAKKSDIPSLSGYATQVWVNEQGFLKSITSAMVITALGYTPYNAANFTKANIKSTLGISDWALAATSPFKNLGKILSTDDLTALVTGIGYTQNYTPVEGAYAYGQIIDFNGTRGHTQIYVIDGASRIHIRNDWNKTGLSNRPWREILTSYSYSSYAVTLDSTAQDIQGVKNFVNGLTATSVICAKGKLRVNASDSVNNFGYIKAITYSSNRGLVHIGSNYGGTSNITNDGADVDAIGIYRGCVGIGRTFTGDELYANQSSGIALQVAGHLKVDGANLSLGGKTITYDAAENAFIFPANILAEGGVAWNTKLDGFDQQTVTAAISVDETTINRTTSGALQLNPAIEARIAALEARVEQLHPTA